MSKSKHFSDINVKVLNENETMLQLEAEPFERGYGVTVGNSLRRITNINTWCCNHINKN